MEEKRSFFGTDGIRGVANVPPLDPETLVRIGKAIASIFIKGKGKHRILIGKDTRLSGYMIETALASGITSMGVDVLLVGPLPTPGVAYLTKSMRADAGVMISASHNSFEDNGIKIFAGDGLKLPDEREMEIERLVASPTLSKQAAESASIGKASRIDDAVGRYTVHLKSFFPREYTLEGLRIGIDCANGAASVVGPQMFSELGAEVISRGVSPNGRNINAGFGSLYPGIVSKLVLEQNLDFGVSLDGDADRIILVDEKGSVVDGDMILALLAVDLHERGLLAGGKVVGTVMSNLGLDKVLAPYGITVVRSAVGDRYVLEEMIKGNLPLGGEQSGHLILRDYSTTGDGLLTALSIATILCRKGRSLSELNAGFVRFPQKLINVPVRDKPDLSKFPSITKAIKASEKDLAQSGRVLVRYSGTENKARVMVECEDEDICAKHAQAIAAVIERELGAV